MSESAQVTSAEVLSALHENDAEDNVELEDQNTSGGELSHTTEDPTDELSQETSDADGTPDAPTDEDTSEKSDQPDSPFSDDFRQLGAAYGVNVDAFTDEKNARAAIALQAERLAAAGSTLDTDDTSTDETASQPEEPTDELDLTGVDPKVAKLVRKMQADNAALQERFTQAQRRAQEAQQTQTRQRWEQVAQRAVGVVDGFASPQLGVGDKLTFAQSAARKAVFSTAGAILKGILSSGNAASVPVIDHVVSMAAELHGVDVSGNKKAGNKPSLKGKAAGEVPKNVKMAPAVDPSTDPLGIRQDPDFLRKMNSIFSKR